MSSSTLCPSLFSRIWREINFLIPNHPPPESPAQGHQEHMSKSVEMGSGAGFLSGPDKQELVPNTIWMNRRTSVDDAIFKMRRTRSGGGEFRAEGHRDRESAVTLLTLLFAPLTSCRRNKMEEQTLSKSSVEP